MKIVLLNALFPPNVVGGAERSVEMIAHGLAGRGHDVVAVSATDERTARCDVVGPIRSWYLPLANIYWPFPFATASSAKKLVWHAIDSVNPAMVKAFGRILDRETPDVVHTNNLVGFSAAAWCAAARRKIPIVHTIRDFYLLCPRSTMFRGGAPCAGQCAECKVYAAPRRQLSRLPRVLSAVSRYMIDAHVRRGYFPRAAVQQSVLSAVTPSTVSRSRTEDGVVRFGFLGQIKPEKGVAEMIQAFGLVRRPGWRLSIAGRGDAGYIEQLRRGASDAVTFDGFVEAAPFLAALDFVIVPSTWHEPLARSVLEAFAVGIPVIASRRGGSPEIVEDGVNGFLFEPSRPAELAAIIERILDNPGMAALLAEGAARSVAGRTADAVAADFEGLYAAARETAERPLP
jgi:glycosyltransferase involved in cell wall biosynthesis